MNEFIALVREMRKVQDAVNESIKAEGVLSTNTVSLMVKQAEIECEVDEYLKKMEE